MKIAGVVVLYNPFVETVLANISTYINGLDQLIIVDNSDYYNNDVYDYYRNNDKVTYCSLGENKGIAFALNVGIDFAKKKQANWLLTMDQDSSFSTGGVNEFLRIVIDGKKNYPDAAIFSPRHNVPYLEQGDELIKVISVMTSGNLVNMAMIDEIGYFDTDLFIDSVDHEFCYRINKKGFEIYRVNQIELEHNLGEIESKKLLGMKIFVTNHSHIRRYYITRNSLFVRKRYSDNNLTFLKFAIIHLFWASLIILLYEKNKVLKFKSTLMGLSDYIHGITGKKF